MTPAPMRVLVTGGQGQLGAALLATAPGHAIVTACDRSTLDITEDLAVHRLVGMIQPDVVINAAAYTAVDQAEGDRATAFAVNAVGAGNVARAAARHGARVIHVSTDFVFDGAKRSPYVEDDPRVALNVYGESKLAGEDAVLAAAPEALVVRSSWVYSATGRNFALTMLRLFRHGTGVRVVDDQVGSPTWARSLADAIWMAADRPAVRGVLHWADAGSATWHEFASAIQSESLALGLIERDVPITAVSTEQFGSPAPRPRYSVLDTGRASMQLGITPAPWRRNLRSMLEEA